MVVVAHHCIGTDINREHLGEEQNLLFNQAAAMFEALAGVGVFATQKGPSDAVVDSVVDSVVVGIAFQADLVFAAMVMSKVNHYRQSTDSVLFKLFV